jgi:hypothetical protein
MLIWPLWFIAGFATVLGPIGIGVAIAATRLRRITRLAGPPSVSRADVRLLVIPRR